LGLNTQGLSGGENEKRNVYELGGPKKFLGKKLLRREISIDIAKGRTTKVLFRGGSRNMWL